MIIWNVSEKATLARLNTASIERSFVPAKDVIWAGYTSHDEWLALYRAWSLFPGSRFEAEFTDEMRVSFARYQQATLMLTTAIIERYALPMLEDLLRLNEDSDFVEYVGYFIKEETYHYVMFMRAIDKIEAEMPTLPPLPRARTEKILKLMLKALRLVPGYRFRTALSLTFFHFAEQVSIHAHSVAKEVVERRDSFVPQVWALHAVDEGRHLQFDRLLLEKLPLGRVKGTVARVIALPIVAIASLAIHLNESWAARQLGVNVGLINILGLLRTPVSPFKQRAVASIRDLVRAGSPPRTGTRRP